MCNLHIQNNEIANSILLLILMEFIGNTVIAKFYYLLIWLNTHILAEKIFRLKPVGISRIEFDKIT